MVSRIAGSILLISLFSALAGADDGAFDLVGPPIQVEVNRGGVILPIAEVPNLRVGDELWIHPELPPDQAAHYLLIVTFLRGSTNPPPENWFTRAETWSKKVREEGVFVPVPDEAQQAVIFLAPETTGDFRTLRSAVRGRPGSFVRAVQDLDQASLDRSRLEAYLTAIRQTANADPSKVHDVSVLLARSLDIRLDEDCFKKPVEEQAACLTQKGGELVLNDGHSQSIVGALTSGASADLIGQLSATPQAGYGYFSPYVGAIMDMGRILDSLRTAQYQYIPALSLPKKNELQLKLNNPPSFHNPKSVIVIALPAIQKEATPPLHAVDAALAACLQRSPLVLPADGAPLVFATPLAHDLTLHIDPAPGKPPNKPIDLPITADASHGGFLVEPQALAAAKLDGISAGALQGTVQGKWGFDAFTGPTYQLQPSKEAKWTLPPADAAGLMAGSAHVLHLESADAACTDHVSLQDEKGDDLKVQWKLAKSDRLELTIPAESAKVSGPVVLDLKEAGRKEDTRIPLRIYAAEAHLKQFTVVPGETHGVLQGSGMKDVESVELNGTRFDRQDVKDQENEQSSNELQLSASDAKETAALHPDGKLTAQVTLKDGRKLSVPALIGSPPPSVNLLNKAIDLGAASQSSPIHLANQDEIPQDGSVWFSLKSEIPATFPRSEKIEIATADSSFHVLLGIQDGGLTLQDQATVVGRFDPAKSFGSSAFGPLQFRPVDKRGVAGDWKPLAKLVRVPSLKELTCPSDATQPCTLKGENLFLLEAVAADPQFSHPATVPEGFISPQLNVPQPKDGTLYVKLRDDPSDVDKLTLPVTALPQPPVPPASPQ
jgi:hypothetical protein